MLDIYNLFNLIIESNVSLVEVACAVATIWGFIYALPNFLTQMKAQNESDIAGETIKLIPSLEQKINKLITCLGRDQKELLEGILEAYEEIKIRIQLLSWFEHIESINQRIDILKIKRKYDDETKKQFLDCEFGEGNWYYESQSQQLQVLFLNIMKKDLNKIYNNPKISIIKGIIIFVLITLIIYVIKCYFAQPSHYNSNIYFLFFRK